MRHMKNPGKKIGNDVWCHLPGEAWAILQSMPKGCDEIFPYSGESVSAAWTRACKFLEIKDLHFHDLRHDGVSRLFEMDWDIPRVASVSGHRDLNSLRRYTHLRGQGDHYQSWPWLQRIIAATVDLGGRKKKGPSGPWRYRCFFWCSVSTLCRCASMQGARSLMCTPQAAFWLPSSGVTNSVIEPFDTLRRKFSMVRWLK